MPFDLSRLGRLIRKELCEILRDRRTIITLVLMPILLYPLLSVAFQQLFLASRLTPEHGVEYHFGFVAAEDEKLFFHRLSWGNEVLTARSAAAQTNDSKSGDPKFKAKSHTGAFEELEAMLRGGKLDAIVRRVRPPAQAVADRGVTREFEITFLPSSPGGQGALSFVERRFTAANEADFGNLLRELHRSKVDVPARVVKLTRTPFEEPAGGAFISLAALVPLILILMTITGAVYPAIDLTAGERERGTLEILVAAPVPRLGLLFAKYVSVVTVAVLTGLVNLIAMTATLILSGVAQALFPNQGLSWVTIIQIFGLLLLFAAFFSAVLLCLTSYARSFKEAQAYLIPLMLVSLAPGVMGMLPGLKLTSWSAAPLVNIVLLARDLFEGNGELGPALVVIGTTLVYAAAAIALAAHIFGDEGVLYSEQGSWGDLFRRPSEPQPVARLSAALWCLALMIPLNFLVEGSLKLLKLNDVVSESTLVLLTQIRSIVVFGVLPALFAWRGHLQWATGFAMISARWFAVVGGLALGFSLWPLQFVVMSWLGVGSGPQSQNEHIQRLIDFYRNQPIPVRLSCVILPALLEDWFFRGYLFGALRRGLSAGQTIVATAFLFGLAHFVLEPNLGIQMGLNRMISSALMGLVLGTVREVCGSVWPGMLLHVVHNSALILLIQDGADQATTIEPWWIAAGAVGVAVGAALVWLGRSSAAANRR